MQEVIERLDTQEEKMQRVIERLDIQEEKMQRVIERLDTQEEKVEGVIERLDKHEEQILNLIEGEKARDKILLEMQEEITRLGNTLTRIEVEHGDKLQAILDVITFHTEKLQEHEDRFERIEKKIERQNNEIIYLKSIVQ